MRRGLLYLLVLAAALPAAAYADPGPPPPPPEPIRPPYYSCRVERSDPSGTVEAFRFISPSGLRHETTFTWNVRAAPEGIGLVAIWGEDGPQPNDFVQIDYGGVDPDDVYRIQIRRSAGETPDGLQLQTGLRRPEDGTLSVFTDWGTLMAILAGTSDPRLAVLNAEGNVLRTDPIDPTAPGRAVATVRGLRPELDALVADYRNRCEFVEGFGITP